VWIKSSFQQIQGGQQIISETNLWASMNPREIPSSLLCALCFSAANKVADAAC
jgi:hypothetical protein